MNRIPPLGPVQAYKTYQIVSPINTHFRPATCAEVECQAHTHGWKTVVDERTEMGSKQAYYIRKESGRKYREDKDLSQGLTLFVFEAGQRCFAQHTVRLDREEVYFTRAGDWRGNPSPHSLYKHTRPEFWLEDFQENLARIRKDSDNG